MIAIYLSPFYILFNIIVVVWLHRWLKAVYPGLSHIMIRSIVTIIYTFFAFCILIGFLLPVGQIKRFFMTIGNYWLGVILYALIIILVFLLIRRILLHTKYKEKIQRRSVLLFNGLLCILMISSISLYGYQHARNIQVTNYDLTINKECSLSSLNIVLVADLHLGYNIGCEQMEQMVEKINSQDPDLIVIAGDFFDNDYDAIEDPEKISQILSKLQSKYGTYAVLGNHDVSEKILAGFTFNYDQIKKADPRMEKLIQDSNITLLKDESVLIDQAFYLYGKLDYEKPGVSKEDVVDYKDITNNIDTAYPIILLDHEPVEYHTIQDMIDLDLSGHTHDGQLFPLNLITDRVWTNSYGYKKVGNMHTIVTSGVGVFGPNMRVGTKAEIVNINITFQEKTDSE